MNRQSVYKKYTIKDDFRGRHTKEVEK